MSRPRRRSSKDPNAKNPNAKNPKKGSRSKGSQSKNNRKARPTVDSFWTDGGAAPRTAEPIRPTPDPAALPRSLGELPLTPDTAADHHLAVVYEEAVRTATALAAANGLLPDDDSE